MDPIEAATHDRDSLTKIAKQCGVRKAACSAWLVDLRDALGVSASVGKSFFARQTYRQAQIKSFAEGRHSAHTRKDKPAKEQAA
jgi:hypothetical protein